jgi:hypothetical protein
LLLAVVVVAGIAVSTEVMADQAAAAAFLNQILPQQDQTAAPQLLVKDTQAAKAAVAQAVFTMAVVAVAVLAVQD